MSNAARRLVVLADTHLPSHSRRQVTSAIRFIGEIQPSEVLHLGDLMDYKTPARWSKGNRDEFEGSVRRESEAGKRFLSALRKVYDGPIGIHEGNHCARPRLYLERYAPALDEFHPFDIDQLLDFDGFGVTLLPAFHPFTPGWVSCHGHLGFSLSRIAGMTALNGAKKIGKSVLMGHTHRSAVVSESTGYGGKLQTITGIEVGHSMAVSRAGDLRGGMANWQSSLAVLDISGSQITPTLVPMRDTGEFVYGGREWRPGALLPR